MSLWEKMVCQDPQCNHQRHIHGRVNSGNDMYGLGACRQRGGTHGETACGCRQFIDRRADPPEVAIARARLFAELMAFTPNSSGNRAASNTLIEDLVKAVERRDTQWANYATQVLKDQLAQTEKERDMYGRDVDRSRGDYDRLMRGVRAIYKRWFIDSTSKPSPYGSLAGIQRDLEGLWGPAEKPEKTAQQALDEELSQLNGEITAIVSGNLDPERVRLAIKAAHAALKAEATMGPDDEW